MPEGIYSTSSLLKMITKQTDNSLTTLMDKMMFRSNQFSYMLPKTILTFVAFIKYPGHFVQLLINNILLLIILINILIFQILTKC